MASAIPSHVLRHIRQRGRLDCMIAVAAIVSRTSYDQAAAFSPVDTKSRGMYPTEIRVILRGVTGLRWSIRRFLWRRALARLAEHAFPIVATIRDPHAAPHAPLHRAGRPVGPRPRVLIPHDGGPLRQKQLARHSSTTARWIPMHSSRSSAIANEKAVPSAGTFNCIPDHALLRVMLRSRIPRGPVEQFDRADPGGFRLPPSMTISNSAKTPAMTAAMAT